MADSREPAEYGTWASPISSKVATDSALTYEEIRLDSSAKVQDVVYWSEMRCNEGGRYVICTLKDGDTEPVEWTPKGFNVRTLVHEYGGGAFFVHAGCVYFSNFEDQRLYMQQSAGSTPSPLTPPGTGFRYADGEYSSKLNKIFAVREDHSEVQAGRAKEPVNTIVMLDPMTQEQTVLASGADFYASPRVSPDGKRIAWMQWVHPNMPWDSTEIWTAALTSAGIEGASCLVGGTDVSVMQPRWTPQNELLYLGDQSDWWNLYHVTASGDHLNLCLREEELGGPQWTLGQSAYSIDPCGTGHILTAFAGHLGLLEARSRNYKPLETGFSSHRHLIFSNTGKAYCIASGPTSFPALLCCNVASRGSVKVLRQTQALPIDVTNISVPSTISWPTTDGQTAHGYFYPPCSGRFCGFPGTHPPLLVKAHGGPTSAATNALNLGIQYFTSRGFAVLDVNYRGSTGYGKQYRRLLKGKWGLLDVADCCSGAQHLVETGRVDRQRLCIDGSSAGGYTTLACLCFHSVFKAGASKYGIGDIGILASETHKFESRYCDQLLAPNIPENKHIFDSRSPMKHIDQFNCPVAFFQGDEDKVVPPNQAEMMFDALNVKKIPCALVMFKGEQHGFRKAENIQKALDGEFYFFARVFGFEPADKHCQLYIENL